MKIRKSSLAILTIFLVGLVCPIMWFRGNALIAGGDYFPDLEPYRGISKYFYIWSEEGLGGTYQPFQLIPYKTFLAILNLLDTPIFIIQRILLYLLFAFSGISMYYLAVILLGTKNKIVPLLSALFYMFNPWALVLIWSVHYTMSIGMIFAYSFFPLMLAVVAKGLKEKKGLKYIAYTSPLITLVSVAGYSNPIIAVLQWTLIAFYFIFHTITERRDARHVLKFAFMFFSTWLLLNAFWILPFLPLTRLYYSVSGYGPLINVRDIDAFRASGRPLFDVLRLSGYWTLQGRVASDSIIHWAPSYSSPLASLSLLLPLLAFVPILLKRKDKNVLFFTFLAILSIFFMKGSNAPLGEFTESFFIKTGLIVPFRNPYHKFGFYVALSYSFLIAYALGETFRRLANINQFSIKRLKKINILTLSHFKGVVPIACIFLLVGLYVWPFWTGDVVHPGGKVIPSARVKIPNYYFEAASWLDSQEDDFNIYSLPLKTHVYAAYWWNNGSEGYLGEDPALTIFSKPIIHLGSNAYGLAGRIAELIVNNRTSGVGELLSLLNAKYVLLHNDTDIVFTNGGYAIIPPSDNFQNILEHSNDLILERKFGELTFYRNLRWRPNQVNLLSNIVTVNGSTNDLFNFIVGVADKFSLNESLFFSSEQLSPFQTAFVTNYEDSVIISSKIVNITVYDGRENPFKWSSLENETYAARYYSEWKNVIRMDGQEEQDTLSFSSPSVCPYKFPAFSPDKWAGYNSTLVFMKTGNKPLIINRIDVNGKLATDIPGVWWETDWMGMTTKLITYPIIIPPYEKAIIQINHRTDDVALHYFDPSASAKVYERNDDPDVMSQKNNPTKYIAHVNTTRPFFIMLSQTFHESWTAFVDGERISDQYHFIANGYANAWYINKTGTYTITLEFWPQNLFYIGSAISITPLILCAIYISKDKIKTLHHCLKKKKRSHTSKITLPRAEPNNFNLREKHP